MDTIDRGMSRSVANVLALQHGIQKSGVVASTATVIGNLCYKGRLRKATVPQVIGILNLYREDVQWIIDRMPDRDTPHLRTANVLGAMAFAHRCSPAEAKEFHDALLTGRGDNGAAEELKRFLASTAAFEIANGGSGGRIALAEIVLQALYNFIHNRTGKLVYATTGLEFFRAKQAENSEKIKALFELKTYWRRQHGEQLPPPTDKELKYRQMREEMAIKPVED
jgi:hypothetical protein